MILNGSDKAKYDYKSNILITKSIGCNIEVKRVYLYDIYMGVSLDGDKGMITLTSNYYYQSICFFIQRGVTKIISINNILYILLSLLH